MKFAICIEGHHQMTQQLKDQALRKLISEPGLVEQLQCLVQDEKQDNAPASSMMCTYKVLCFSEGVVEQDQFRRTCDLLTMGFRCSGVAPGAAAAAADPKRRQAVGKRLADACIHCIKYVPNFPHHAGVQALVRFLYTSVLQDDHVTQGKCISMVPRSYKKTMLTVMPEKGHVSPTSLFLPAKLSAEWHHAKSTFQDAAQVVALREPARLLFSARPQEQQQQQPCTQTATAWVLCNQLNEWLIALPRIREIGYDSALPAQMLDMLTACMPEEHCGGKKEEIIVTGQHMLCMQTYVAPYDRKASLARLVIANEDTCSSPYIHPIKVLQAPQNKNGRRRLADTHIAASFLFLLKQAMELPREENRFAVSSFSYSYLDRYDFVRVNKVLSFHWATLRVPGRMNKPLQVGLWVTGQRNLDPRNANTYVTPDMLSE